MLTIRHSQQHVLIQERLRSKPQRFISYVENFYPEEALAIGSENLREHVCAGLEQALSYGFHKTCDLFRFLDIVMICGLDWSAPEHSWMINVLTDQRNPNLSQRLSGLRYQLMERLEASGL